MEVFVQVNVPPIAETDGGVVFWVIDTTAEFVQLFVEFVTTKV